MIIKNNVKKDKELTIAAKKIFGSILKRAYIEVYDHKKEQDRLDAFERYKPIIEKDGTIENGCTDIILEFKNGNLVSITNSEWGAISKYEAS